MKLNKMKYLLLIITFFLFYSCKKGTNSQANKPYLIYKALSGDITISDPNKIFALKHSATSTRPADYVISGTEEVLVNQIAFYIQTNKLEVKDYPLTAGGSTCYLINARMQFSSPASTVTYFTITRYSNGTIDGKFFCDVINADKTIGFSTDGSFNNVPVKE